MKTLEFNGKIYTIKELTIEEGLNFDQTLDEKSRTYDFMVKCIEPIMTVEEFKKLPFREGIALINAVNEINGLSNFPKPTSN